MTRQCPSWTGLMSMKASVSASSNSLKHGTSPATILQKMQSGSAAMSPSSQLRQPERLAAFALAIARGDADVAQHSWGEPRQLRPRAAAAIALGEVTVQPGQGAQPGFDDPANGGRVGRTASRRTDSGGSTHVYDPRTQT